MTDFYRKVNKFFQKFAKCDNFWHLISIHQEFKTLFEFESTETQQYLDWKMKIPHFWCEKTKIMTGIKCATSRNRPAL